MAEKRERHAEIFVRIWDDPDWKARSPLAQWLYMLLLSQANRNWAGVLDMTFKRWTKLAAGAEAVLNPSLNELIEHRYVVVDWDTEELLIRSFIRNDKVYKQPNVLKAALREAQEVHSWALRVALADELRRIGMEKTIEVADLLIQGCPKGFLNPSRNPSANPSGNPSVEGSADPSAKGSVGPSSSEPFREPFGEGFGKPRGEGEGVSSSSSVGFNSSSSSSSELAPRADVDQLCERLRARIVDNGAKATITKAWRDEGRRLLDRDGRDLNQALRLIDWATGHSFWASNILSMPKFRQKYDQLLMQARREQQQRQGGPARLSTSDARVIAAERLKTNPDPRILAIGGPALPGPALALPGGEVA
jgi:hypothetical protein